MPLTSHGRIVDERGRGLPGLVVEAWGAGAAAGAEMLAEERTDAAGAFALTLPTNAFEELLAVAPDVALRVFDRAGIRLLQETRPVFADEGAPADLGVVTLRRREVEGWLVTDGAGRTTRVAEGNDVEWLVDGEAMFRAALRAVQRARRSVHVQQLLFKADFAAEFPGASREGGVLFVDALVEACRRGAKVRVLLNENAVMVDDVDEVRAALAPCAGAASVRGFPSSPEVMHAKVVVVDDEEAIVVGLPFEPRWWDSRGHPVRDERRGKGQPMHDVGARLRGPAVALVGELFAALWNSRGESGDEPLAAPHGGTARGAARVQALVTLPDALGGETGILQAYERALAMAERLVYIESQYFTSARIGRAIARALRAKPRLEVILLVNEHMDVPFRHYDRLLAQRLAELGFPDNPRLGAFSPWTHARMRGGSVVAPIYVHSKVAVADDAWATTGSANLDGYSLDSADEFALRNVRCVEWNFALLDGTEGAPATGLVRALRADLWSEALGRDAESLREEPPEGWLAVWRHIADEHLRALAEGKAMRGFVLRHGVELPKGVKVERRGLNLFNRR